MTSVGLTETVGREDELRGRRSQDAAQSDVRQRRDGPRQGQVLPGDRAGPGGVRPAEQGRDAGHSEGAGAQQAEEEGAASQDDPGENKVLRHLLLLPDSHHRVLCPHVPRPLHRGPRPGHPHRGLRGEARGVPSDPEPSHSG